MGRLARAFFVGAAVISACGTPTRDAASTPPDTAVADCAPTTFELVDAAQVEIVGDMTKEHQEIAAWALDRFDQASLDLPSRIQVGFDPDRSMCHGATGVCHPQRVPPEALVCEPDDGFKAQQIAQRVTLLHELGHLWDWSQGDGTGWPDRQAIVGGSTSGPDVPWAERTEERVAVAISWGLLDQYRRPVRSELPCVELYRQFVSLTGQAPLDPIEVVCVPE